MAITLVFATTVAPNSSINLTNAVGDYILLWDTDTVTWTGTVSGFDEIIDITSPAGTQVQGRVYERFATGSNETIQANSAAVNGRCVCVYRGVDGTTPLRQAAATNQGDVTTLDIPAQGSGSPNGRAVAGFYARSTNTDITPNAPLAERAALSFPAMVIADTGDTMVASLSAQNLTMQTSTDWIAWSLILNPASTGITLAADAGSYAITGTAASLERGREVAGDGGSYAVTGTAASLEYGREVAAAAGSYAVSGTAAGLSITAKKLAAGAGSYAITGADAALELGREVAADAGSYAVTGTDAALEYGYEVVGETGSYAVSGTDAALAITAKAVEAAAGSYAVTGTDAALSVTAKVVAAATGSYAITGTDASLEYGYEVAAPAGSYAVSGTDAALSVIGDGVILSADGGSYAITGSDAALEWGRLLSAEGGSYAIAGTDAALVTGVEAPVEPEQPVNPLLGGGPGGPGTAGRLKRRNRWELTLEAHRLLAQEDHSPPIERKIDAIEVALDAPRTETAIPVPVPVELSAETRTAIINALAPRRVVIDFTPPPKPVLEPEPEPIDPEVEMDNDLMMFVAHYG